MTATVADAPLYLVDGSGYIFRAFFAVQPLSNNQGLPTNALFGFTRMMIKLLRDAEVKSGTTPYVVVIFDTGSKNFRHELFPEYKANRVECPPDLLVQMPYFRKIVRALGVQCLEQAGFEADDIIATLAARMEILQRQTIVVSGDKDLTQLVSDKVKVWDPMRDKVFDREKVKENFGVYPEQIGDYLALTGDSSDNIPGVRGIGPKTAARLIEHFGNIDELLNRVQEIETISDLRGAKSVRLKIESSLETLRLSRSLVRLENQIEPYAGFQNLEEFKWQYMDDDVSRALFEELDFSSLLTSLRRTASTKDSQSTSLYQTVTEATLEQFIEDLSQVQAFAFDTETSSLDYKTCTLVGISIAWKPNEAWFVPLGMESAPEANLNLERIKNLLYPIFANPSVKKYGVNLKFDIEVLSEQGFNVRGAAFDAMLASYVLNPDKREHGLKAMTRIHLGEEMVSYEQVVAKGQSIGTAALADVSRYACHDADASFRLVEILDRKIGPRAEGEEGSLRKVFEEVEMPLVPVLVNMERAGIKVDVEFLKTLEEEFSSELEILEGRIKDMAGVEFNINSPKQLGKVLFEDLAISAKGVKRTQSGYSTDASVLSKLIDEHPIVAQLLEYREIHKLKSTYVEALQRLLVPETGRIHASFNQAIAATGRLSSSEPNLQNIPIRNDRGRRLRAAFIAESGHSLISADYSQIELRVLAHLSKDNRLQEAFRSGEDIHLTTAKEIFGAAGLSGQELTKLRRIAKTINFGVIYGMGAFRLAQELSVSRKQAQEYIDEYFARYPRVRQYFDGVAETAETVGFVTTLCGRRRYAQELDTVGRDAGYRARSMMNAPIQGTAAEIIKIAMIRLDQRLAEFGACARMVLQVHDELVFEVRDDLLDIVSKEVVTQMEQALTLDVPLKVDWRIGKTWGEGG